ncbi:MAG: hypothetical protein AB8G22_02090 [Saprospiraceae bacterium]
MNRTFEDLKEFFRDFYNHSDLNNHFKTIVRQFISANANLLHDQGVSSQFFRYPTMSSFNKDHLSSMAALLFYKEEIYQQFREWIPEEVCKALDYLVWEEKATQAKILTEIGVDFTETTQRKLYGGGIQEVAAIRKEFAFFKSRSRSYWSYYQNKADFMIWLPKEVRRVVSKYYKLPAEAELVSIPKPADNHYLYDKGEKDILTELPRLLAYAKQDQIKMTSKGLPMASTLNKMQRKLNLAEFFPNTKDKVLKNIRTNLVASLILTLTKGQQSRLDLPSLLRDYLFTQNIRKKYKSLSAIHRELKGTGYLDERSTSGVEKMYVNFLTLLPEGWISMDSFYNNLRFHFYDLQPVSEYIAREKLYFTIDRARGYKEKSYITESDYNSAITKPYLKGMMFLFAAFGLLDIAYDEPDTTEIGETTYSAYDGLEAIRLTDLGRYVIGKNLTYETSNVIKEHKLILSEDALMITAEDADDTADILLEPYTEKIGPNRYRTDNSFFLSGCRSKKDLHSKISLFKQSIKVNLPPNWEAFFKKLENKIDPLNAVADVKIFQIPAEDRELIRLIARDSLLKSLVYKAENYMLIIPTKDFSKFKKRLQEFGYLMTN